MHEGMKRLAEVTREGRDCLLKRDFHRLGELINENFDLRASMVKLDPRNIEMVRLARRLGACAHYAGSGGSILGICEDEAQFSTLSRAFAEVGCNVIRPVVQ